MHALENKPWKDRKPRPLTALCSCTKSEKPFLLMRMAAEQVKHVDLAR